MRRIAFASLAMLLMVALSISAARAGGTAKFHSSSSAVNSAGALVLSWDQRGLGNDNITYLLSANATADYQCVTRGNGNNPDTKRTVSGTVEFNITLQPKNGRIQVPNSLFDGVVGGPPPPPADFECDGKGSGLLFGLTRVSYTNIVIYDTTNRVIEYVADASRTF